MNSTVLLTSNHPRHRYVARVLAQCLELTGIAAEAKSVASEKPKSGVSMTSDEEAIYRHFQQRDEAEARYFGSSGEFPVPGDDLLLLPHGEVNSPNTFDWIQARRPDSVVLFGTSIIRDPLLSAYEGRMINLHLGLSPYYRGSGTNFWPLVNREPECVGFTIHLAVAKVDAGDILIQGRPAASEGDGCHDLGCKTIKAAAQVLGEIVEGCLRGVVRPLPQTGQGRCYWRRHFNADAVRRMQQSFQSGMMPEYLRDKAARDGRFPIIGG